MKEQIYSGNVEITVGNKEFIKYFYNDEYCTCKKPIRGILGASSGLYLCNKCGSPLKPDINENKGSMAAAILAGGA